ncbi:hypothetical protein GGQ80_001057 [Sphingomonas jinjuensis]|uniref:Uncharacterized protein n=1 Tax=Sphingomonas jinjuensis TaxID=535907 RepID=A0A840F5W6_9SPHN|nr:hypothetical protein [Sphingomonas jinjuensis]MBB4153169.1 hypothetical protein [Sphingomonas jinjuensis]
MYEFTMGGAWFKWSLLDAASKRLAAGSFAAATIAAVPLGIYVSNIGHAVGYRLGAAAAGAPVERAPASAMLAGAEPWMAWITLIFGIVSAVLWWRFSRRQDEMFNRVQNWALGMGGGWTMAACFVWIALASAGAVAMPSTIAIAALFYVLLFAFWFVAVKRWA